MTIYTSYYAFAKKLNSKDYAFVRVSNSQPKWWDKPTTALAEVFPKWELVDGVKKGLITEEEYNTEYLKMLDTLDKKALLEKIYFDKNACGYKDIVLLCYEKPGDFCHRHILADWIGTVKELSSDLIKTQADVEPVDNRIRVR